MEGVALQMMTVNIEDDSRGDKIPAFPAQLLVLYCTFMLRQIGYLFINIYRCSRTRRGNHSEHFSFISIQMLWAVAAGALHQTASDGTNLSQFSSRIPVLDSLFMLM